MPDITIADIALNNTRNNKEEIDRLRTRIIQLENGYERLAVKIIELTERLKQRVDGGF